MATHREIISARSWLFAPGDSERKMEKATAGAADIVIFDLEDAVAEGEKLKARSMVTSALRVRCRSMPYCIRRHAIPQTSCDRS